MPLQIYNTLSRRKEPFEPIEPGKVRMYVCGVTVYDDSHLGHARSYIGWDVVRRYLEWQGYAVRYVQNFTDIDDKIIRRSQEEQCPWYEITQKYTTAYLDDMAALNVLPATAYPKVSESIPQIIRFIQQLIAKDYAYPVAGDVYYAVERFPDYGKLSRRKLDQMEAGASGRVDEEDVQKQKRHPFDFALWKGAKPGEPEWDSPWGKGRPGWHIECSAMVQEWLGDRIDIHTGGEDLVFPHHENEIAQSEAALAQPLATYWMHNAFVKVHGDKMSKSLKNFTTIRSLLENTNPMVVRLFVLQAHYRSPIDFTDDAIAAAENGWKTLQEAALAHDQFAKLPDWSTVSSAELDPDACDRFNTAMDDDFNTPVALAVLFELAKDLRREKNILIHDNQTDTKIDQLYQRWHTLNQLMTVLGLDPKVVNLYPTSLVAGTGIGVGGKIAPLLSDADIEALIEQRKAARSAKNFAEGDRIRDQLQIQGITLIDKPGGITLWHREH
jgi:cysteinyl-tRNA synthetase